VDEAPISRTSVGSATFTIVPSMPIISSARHNTPSTTQRRASAAGATDPAGTPASIVVTGASNHVTHAAWWQRCAPCPAPG
jgi:hypothetical protein